MNPKAKKRLCAFVTVCLFAIGASLFWQHNSNPVPEREQQAWWAGDNFSASVENIQMLSHFRNVTNRGDAVLFTDAIYNGWTRRYRNSYTDFSQWLIHNYSHRPMFVDLTVSNESTASIAMHVEPELFHAIQELLQERKSSFGYKNYYGAGVIAWIRNGEAIDIDCIVNFNSLDELCERTKTNFAIAR